MAVSIHDRDDTTLYIEREAFVYLSERNLTVLCFGVFKSIYSLPHIFRGLFNLQYSVH